MNRILLGTLVAFGHILPIWLGTVLLTGGTAQTIITRRPNDGTGGV